MSQDFPHGFVLSEAAIYAFQCQEVYPDIISFAAAIPNHLKPLFLIPIKLESIVSSIAKRVASSHLALPTGDTPEGELFGDKTFVTYDNDSSAPGTTPGSIFEINDPENMTHHQEFNYDENIQVPTDTSYLSDIDVTQYQTYPYRTPEKPRHSSYIPHVTFVRIALKSDTLETHTPGKIQENAKACAVTLISYDKKTRVFNFDVKASSTPRRVQAALNEIDHIALSCNCPFWRYNGPEFHAKENSFMLGQPFGTATPPDVRDPDRQYWLCKHSYAVLRRLESFVQQVTEENWELDDDELLNVVDEEWDRMEGTALIPAEDLEKDDVDLEVDWGDETPEDEALEEQVEEEAVEEAVEDANRPDSEERAPESQEPSQVDEQAPESIEPEIPFEDEYNVQAPVEEEPPASEEPEVPFEDAVPEEEQGSENYDVPEEEVPVEPSEEQAEDYSDEEEEEEESKSQKD